MKSAVSRSWRAAFTLVELMVAMSLLLLIAYVLFSSTNSAARMWSHSQARAEQFRTARLAFETMTRRLSQATLNPHWDYKYAADDPQKQRPPIAYVRQSFLRFRSGPLSRLVPSSTFIRPTQGVFFQAPLGVVEDENLDNLDRLLNTVGYFVEVADDRDFIPGFLRDRSNRVRYRLMELQTPAEKLRIFGLNADLPDDRWFQQPLEGKERPVRVLAENVVALVILPGLPRDEEQQRLKQGKGVLCPGFEYDSSLTSNYVPPLAPPDPDINPHHQLPPVVRVCMVAIDEPSAVKLARNHGGDPLLGLDTSALFKKAEDLENDLLLFENQLRGRKVDYQLFSTSVPLRGARWSRAETL